jgi:hypothetical protein
MVGCLAEVADVCSSADARHDNVNSGRVQSFDGAVLFEDSRPREYKWLNWRSPVAQPAGFNSTLAKRVVFPKSGNSSRPRRGCDCEFDLAFTIRELAAASCAPASGLAGIEHSRSAAIFSGELEPSSMRLVTHEAI